MSYQTKELKLLQTNPNQCKPRSSCCRDCSQNTGTVFLPQKNLLQYPDRCGAFLDVADYDFTLFLQNVHNSIRYFFSTPFLHSHILISFTAYAAVAAAGLLACNRFEGDEAQSFNINMNHLLVRNNFISF